jgi:hypothetical protein
MGYTEAINQIIRDGKQLTSESSFYLALFVEETGKFRYENFLPVQ